MVWLVRQVSEGAIPGCMRQATQFALKLNFLTDATIDVLFSKVRTGEFNFNLSALRFDTVAVKLKSVVIQIMMIILQAPPYSSVKSY